MDGVIGYLLGKKYTDDSLAGAGALKGVPCTIQSIVDNPNGSHTVTFAWEDNSGNTHTDTMTVFDGEKGDKGDKGNTGATGATGAKGDTGTAATVRVGSVTSGVSPSVTNSGTAQDAVLDFVLAKGDKGDTGAKGADGQDGKSFDIKAQYPTEAALIAAHPTGEAGDAYFVGTDENPDLYIWLTDDAEWFNNGKIAGVKGDKGDTGDDGFSPVASVSKSGGTATISIRDKVGQTTATVSDGYTPSASVSKVDDVLTVSITDQSGTTTASIDLSEKADVADLGTAAAKNFTDRVQPNNRGLVESNAVWSAINTAMSSIYTPRGDLTCAELTASLLIAANVGNVYEMSDSGTTTDLFLQGAGESIAVGDNVGVIQVGESTYKFNLMAGAIDLTDYQKKDLDTPLTIGGVSKTTVEDALGALNTETQKVLYSNPNLLDNPWFTVNQRGASSYAADWVYTVDRWIKGENYTINVGSNGVSASTISGTHGHLSQRLDIYSGLVGKTVTLSLLKSTGELLQASGTVLSTAGTSVYINDNDIWCALVKDANFDFIACNFKNTSVTVRAVKLEIGTVSTLALDTAPNYASELAKCQRYFQRVSSNSANIAFALVNSTTSFRTIMYLPCAMRTTPSVSYSGVNIVSVKNESTIALASGALTVQSLKGNSICFVIDYSTGGLTAGDMRLLQTATNGYIDLSADL